MILALLMIVAVALLALTVAWLLLPAIGLLCAGAVVAGMAQGGADPPRGKLLA